MPRFLFVWVSHAHTAPELARVLADGCCASVVPSDPWRTTVPFPSSACRIGDVP
ncbi:MAG: hypothetical protein JWO59_2764, partial [Chloroflexi bacterium]|nr:hypothetical protein [Chloroflexota bacterium]